VQTDSFACENPVIAWNTEPLAMVPSTGVRQFVDPPLGATRARHIFALLPDMLVAMNFSASTLQFNALLETFIGNRLRRISTLLNGR
jgi:hypothetical protein